MGDARTLMGDPPSDPSSPSSDPPSSLCAMKRISFISIPTVCLALAGIVIVISFRRPYDMSATARESLMRAIARSEYSEKYINIPSSAQLWDPQASPQVPRRAQSSWSLTRKEIWWPTGRTVERRRPKGKESRVKQESKITGRWLRKRIRNEWLPPDVEDRLIPIENWHAGHDYFILRYAHKGWAFQIADSIDLCIVVMAPENTKEHGSIAGNALRIAKQTLKYPEWVIPFLRAEGGVFSEQLNEVWRGSIQDSTNLGDPTIPPPWYRFVQWWTDGTSIAFWVEKLKYIPKDDKGVPSYPDYQKSITSEWPHEKFE